MQSINGFNFEDEFCHFISRELVTDSRARAEFWDQFTALLQQSPSGGTSVASVDRNDVSLLNPRYALKAINARWGSLYSALYHEDAIPHSAGLKTGRRFNVARASRVIDYTREFLDTAFPLSEGSHKDAVSYLVYFQNMMVTLADGSTVGLRNPAHYVAKSGPRDDPQALILRNPDVHVEIRFDRSGSIGATDMANIEDILVEAPARTVLSCEANTVTDKCEVLRNLQQLTSGRLAVQFNRDGKVRTRRLNRNEEFTSRNGDNYIVQTRNPVALQLHADALCPAVKDSDDHPLPGAVVDAALFSLITCDSNDSNIALMVSGREAYELVKPVLAQLQHNIDKKYSIELLTNYRNDAKDQTITADIPPPHVPWVRIAEEELKNTATIAKQNTAVLNAIQHSYLPH